MYKRTFLKLVLGFSILTALSFKDDVSIKAKDIQQHFVALNDKLHIDKYEVSNGSYKKFLSYLKSTGQNDLYNKCLQDTAQWSDNKQMKADYHAHKAYENHPVVAISYDAANEYCNWLTSQYNGDKDRKFKKVIFRLPTEQEWINAASNGDNNKMYPWGNFYLRNRKGEFLCNFLRLGDQSITYDQTTKSYKIIEGVTDITTLLTAINAFEPSPSGLYNVSGNAAEMVAEKGLAKGGSFNDPGYDVRIASKKYYNGPSTTIGFRVLMEVIEK